MTRLLAVCLSFLDLKRSVTSSRLLTCLSILLVLTVSSGVVAGQSYIYAAGSPSFTTAEPVELGFINLSNGNLHIEIPIAGSPQRGSVPFVAKLVYDSRIWFAGVTWFPTNVKQAQGDQLGNDIVAQGGWRLVTTADLGTYHFVHTGTDCDGEPGGPKQDDWSNFTWRSPDGTLHTFGSLTTSKDACINPIEDFPTAAGWADDSSGLYMSIVNHASATIYARDGTVVYPTVKDTNGNYFSKDATGNPVDTLGRTAVAITTNGNQTTYSVPNSQGVTSNIVITTTTVNYNTAFGQSGVAEASGSFAAISSIALPDGTSYSFTYDSGITSGNYGLLKTMTLPTGGTVTYGYTTFADAFGNRNRWVSARTPNPGAQWTYSPAVITTCSQGQVGCQQKVTLTKPSNDVAVYTFTLNNGAWNSKIDFYTGAVSASNLQMTLLTDYDFTNPCPQGICVGARYIRSVRNTTQMPTVGATTLTKKVEYTYDNPTFANISLIQEWPWYTGTPPTASRKTTIVYNTDPSYLARNIINRPISVTVATGGGTWVSETDTLYDTATPNAISGIVHWTDPVTNVRGNPTKIRRLLASGAACPSATGCLETVLAYDGTGQVVGITDPKGNSTSMSYADNFYNDNGANPPQSYTPAQATNAFVTQITPPLIGAASLGHYFGSGKLALVTDQNAATSYQHHVDSLDRQTHFFGPLVGSARAWKLVQYPSGTETEVDVYTGVNDTTASTSCVSCRKDMITLDGLGRLTRSTITNDPEGATKADTAYDTSGRIATVLNPYRATANGSDTFVYDGINRTLSVTHADTNVQSAYYGAAVGSNGGLTTQQCVSGTYGIGYPSLFVDEAGRKRQVWTDGLGRTIETDEPSPSTGSITTGGFSTCYTYDLLNNLKQVTQGSQTRTYAYDALSRVTSITTPEANNTAATISYLTAANALCSGDPGDVCYQQDGRGATSRVTYAYDALNRLTSKTYADGTPTVTYFYDQTTYNGLPITNGKGRRTGMSDNSGNGVTAWSYDAAGRVLKEKRKIGTVTRTSDYSYTVGGQLASISYPYASTADRNVVYT